MKKGDKVIVTELGYSDERTGIKVGDEVELCEDKGTWWVVKNSKYHSSNSGSGYGQIYKIHLKEKLIFKIGDRVEALERIETSCNGVWKTGQIIKADTTNCSYFVIFDNGHSSWRKSDRVKATKLIFKIGDRVKITEPANVNTGKYGEIVKFCSLKYPWFVRCNDGLKQRYEEKYLELLPDFKVGVKVRIVDCNFSTLSTIGDEAVITKLPTDTNRLFNLRCDKWGREQAAILGRFELIKEETKMKYKLLKKISIKALEDAGACKGELHRFAFVAMKTFNYNFYSNIQIKDVITIATQCVDGIKWLINNRFIQKHTDIERYTFGARFFNQSEKECALVRINTNSARMVGIEEGSFWEADNLNCVGLTPSWTFEELKNQFCGIKLIED